MMGVEPGTLTRSLEDGVCTLTFAHRKANSLPLSLLTELAEAIAGLSAEPEVKVVVLTSAGEGTFSAGASFDEFKAIADQQSAAAFFMGFSKVILAIRSLPKFVVARVQGKAVGGGVGLIAASDYALAVDNAAVRLSEFELGIGPFTVGPAVARRIGEAAFGAMSIDTEWRSAGWAAERGLYARVYPTIAELDGGVASLTGRLAKASPAATAEIKQMLWAGTEHWDELLPARASLSGRLLLAQRSAETGR